MVLGRAVLGTDTLDQALAVLADAPSGGFHFALMHRRDPRIVSVEFGGGERSVREITSDTAHANHALHLPRGLAAQIITQSSGDRQLRGDALVAQRVAPLDILRDVAPTGLPIRRDTSDDPDEENTLGTAILALAEGRLNWSIHDRADGEPAYCGTA